MDNGVTINIEFRLTEFRVVMLSITEYSIIKPNLLEVAASMISLCNNFTQKFVQLIKITNLC